VTSAPVPAAGLPDGSLRPSAGLAFQAPAGAFPLGAVFGGMTILGCAVVGLLGLDRLGPTFCFFKLTTGLPCPTCGATRALGRLAHLDLAGAIAMNPLVAAGGLAVLAWGVVDLVLLPGRRALRFEARGPWPTRIRLLALAALAANWAFLLLARR
jgi:hypothetical protein